MYEIRRAGTKGLGLFATQGIARGTRILAERPMFTVKSERDVYAATRSLSPEDRNYLAQLSVSGNTSSWLLEYLKAAWDVTRGSFSMTSHERRASTSRLGLSTIPEYMTLLAAFRNNNFDIGNNTQAVFGEICRLNHACVPNTQGNFNANIGCFTIHALRPIEEKEQITVSYLEIHAAIKDVRQALLWRGYGFHCDCPVCDLSTERSRSGERRRAGLRNGLVRYAEQAAAREKQDVGSELQMLKEMMRCFEEEGIAGRELATMYLAAAEGCTKIGDRKEALRNSQMGLEMEEMCLGSDNPLYKESVQRMKTISAK